MQIREEIALINLHERAHVTGEGQVKQLDPSCQYCQSHALGAKVPLPKPIPSANIRQQPTDKNDSKKVSIVNELERTVNLAGRNGHVVVPRSWAGKRVKISLLT